jgi:hypothetical protein
MHIRRGGRVETEGERRGGDQKSDERIKVTRAVTLIADAEKMERSRDRELAERADVVPGKPLRGV